MKIHNTLTNKKEEFKPIQDGKVSMYVCGPTVYNLIHIGNARPMIVFDTVRRYFMYKGYDVNYVSNFTDVDDKIIKAANEEGVSSEEISEKYIAECLKDMEGMNVMPASSAPRATREIPEMIDMIQTLIDKGSAYEAKDGTVYFRIRSFAPYGKLSNKNLDEMESGHRKEKEAIKVTGEDQKEDPFDFVLWKPKKEGEPFWESQWCAGRPGWHIECSVMAKKYLGDTIDIHAGGEDLIFPHHENEIAQSEAANGVPFSNYWMHNAFLNIDGTKMSKSLGNFFTVRDISEKYDLGVLRFFMLNAHYRSPLNFSRELMESAANGLERIKNCANNLDFLIKNKGEAEGCCEAGEFGEEFVRRFEEAMEDDFNTADAIAVIFELVREINSKIDEKSTSGEVAAAKHVLETLTNVLGLKIESQAEDLSAEVEALIEERQKARKNRDFARADEIRDSLKARGIVLEDTKEGVKWRVES